MFNLALRFAPERMAFRPGRIIAGAHLGMNEAVANMVALADVPLAHALHMASGVPAAVLGLDQIYGGIAEGRPASLTCLAADLTPEAAYVHGCRSAA